jgi:hypothetical protein
MTRFAWTGLLAVASVACDEPSPGPTMADCSRDGAFAVSLGQGEDTYADIPTDVSPELIHGGQGGTHLILAARLDTPDPIERYMVSLLVEAGQAPCADDCAGWTRIGGFSFELDSTSGRLEQTGPQEVELTSLFVIVENWEAAPRRRVTLEISDQCERRASAVRIFE